MHCERTPSIRLIHSSFHLFFPFFFFLVITLKFYSPSKFQLYNTVYNHHVIHYILIPYSSYHRKCVPTYHQPPTPTPGNHHPLCFCDSVLVGSVSRNLCIFFLGYRICWHLIVHRSFLQSLVFLSY